VSLTLGVALPTSGSKASPETIRQVAEGAERIGLAAVWTFERLLRPTAPIPLGGHWPDDGAAGCLGHRVRSTGDTQLRRGRRGRHQPRGAPARRGDGARRIRAPGGFARQPHRSGVGLHRGRRPRCPLPAGEGGGRRGAERAPRRPERRATGLYSACDLEATCGALGPIGHSGSDRRGDEGANSTLRLRLRPNLVLDAQG
jgi:hypothetical protein